LPTFEEKYIFESIPPEDKNLEEGIFPKKRK
jgi:hypothetical protein